MGISSDACSYLRNSDRVTSVLPGCFLGLVSVCFRIPNTNAIQPSIQQRFTDISYSWWTEGGQVIQKQGVVIHCSSGLILGRYISVSLFYLCMCI